MFLLCVRSLKIPGLFQGGRFISPLSLGYALHTLEEGVFSPILDKIGEIGYILNPEYWGRGFATDVSKLLIDFGFKEYKLHRIFATCDPRNIGSSRVLEKAGMRKEGRIRENLLIKDGWRDSLLYSVLEHEWKK